MGQGIQEGKTSTFLELSHVNWIILILFFASGACGLIYEVVWARMMTEVLGKTALSVGTVLGAFMCGLALGAYALGKYADRSDNPLRLYAFYEIGVGVTALVASLLITWIMPAYVRLYAVFGSAPLVLAVFRFSISFVILMAPTILMGATLPILSRVVVNKLSHVGNDLGRLYAINTIGAVAGSLATGFYFIGTFGVHRTIAIAVFGNLAVGAAAWLVSKKIPPIVQDAPIKSRPDPVPDPLRTEAGEIPRVSMMIPFLAFAFSGFASFAYEIFWTRSLVFLLGNSSYAFTLMLTAFLSGIALGGYLIRFVSDRIKKPLMLFAVIEILIGIFSAAALPLLFIIMKSDSLRNLIIRMSGRLGFLILSNFGTALILMLFPAILIGATFPLMGRIFVNDLRSRGAVIGKVYAINTVGNVLGALLPGLLLIPFFGIEKGILIMAVLNCCLGLGIALSSNKYSKMGAFLAPVAFLFITAIIWRIPIGFQFPSERESPADETLFYKEGPLATTKVFENPETGERLMSIDGIIIGGTGSTEYKQQILAHLPKLLLKSYWNELSIGLGSGILIGESSRHPALRKIVCVEIEPSVVEGARQFDENNYHVLDDLRTTIVVDDVAHFLETTPARYDIISADEKTAENYASNGFSYSVNYYGLLKQRLAEEGLVIQWVPDDLPPKQLRLVLGTFLDAFPHVMLWYFPGVRKDTGGGLFLVGSRQRIGVDLEWMKKAMQSDPGAFQGIFKYGLTTPESILAHFVADEETLRRTILPGRVNSLETPYYEFYSPGDYSVKSPERTWENLKMIIGLKQNNIEKFITESASESEASRLHAAFEAEDLFLRAEETKQPPDIFPVLEKAISIAPWNPNLRNQVLLYYWTSAGYLYLEGDYAQALRLIQRAAEICPENGEVRYYHGLILWKTNQPERARSELEESVTLNPRFVPSRRLLASLYAMRGQMEKAAIEWRSLLALSPKDVSSLVSYGNYLSRQIITRSEGLMYLGRAYGFAPRDPSVIDAYAWALYLEGKRAPAVRVIHKGGKYYVGQPVFEYHRGIILAGG